MAEVMEVMKCEEEGSQESPADTHGQVNYLLNVARSGSYADTGIYMYDEIAAEPKQCRMVGLDSPEV